MIKSQVTATPYEEIVGLPKQLDPALLDLADSLAR